MILKNNKQVCIEFGYGDIGVNSGIITESGSKIGIITFRDQEAREIGSEGDIKAGQVYNFTDFPIVLSFTKKESIDIIIKTLTDIKNIMEV